MPKYRATRFINTREADTYHFTAANDQEAIETLLSGDNLDLTASSVEIECDVADEILALDRRNEDGSYKTVDDEIELPGEMPYGQPSRDFVTRVATLSEEDAFDDEMLRVLIRDARALCGTGVTP